MFTTSDLADVIFTVRDVLDVRCNVRRSQIQFTDRCCGNPAHFALRVANEDAESRSRDAVIDDMHGRHLFACLSESPSVVSTSHDMRTLTRDSIALWLESSVALKVATRRHWLQVTESPLARREMQSAHTECPQEKAILRLAVHPAWHTSQLWCAIAAACMSAITTLRSS